MLPMVTFSFQGENGAYYGRQHVEHYMERAKGGAGLIIIQGTNVSGVRTGTEMWSPASEAALRQIVKSVHSYGSTILIQLAVYDDLNINLLSSAQICDIQADLEQTAVKASYMGFDGVEYHFAHGFTLCRFFDRLVNQRSDEYGGSLENRARILLGILPAIRAKTHDRFVVSVRMGEYLPASEEGAEMARILEQAGIDMLNISFGMQPPVHPVPQDFPCSPMTYSGCKIKRAVNIPVIAVNEIRTEAQVRFLIGNEHCDFVGIGRGMLADPEFANHVINSEEVTACRGCRNCLWFTDHTRCPAKKGKCTF